jgi:hypothetical protein
MDPSFKSEDLERLRRSVVLLAPRHPGGLDREAAIAVLEELQRLQTRDQRVTELLDQVRAMIAGEARLKRDPEARR